MKDENSQVPETFDEQEQPALKKEGFDCFLPDGSVFLSALFVS